MKTLFTAVLSVIMLSAQAQFDRLQTNYMYNPFTFNPAIAGEQGYMNAALSYRRQWWGFAGAPETFVLSMDSPVKDVHHNIGSAITCDRFGVVSQTTLKFAYAYRIATRNAFFAAGLAPELVSTRMAWNEINPVQQDVVFSGPVRAFRFGISFGIYFHSKHFFAGLSGRGISGKDALIGTTNQPFHLYTGFRFGERERAWFTVSTLMRFMAPEYFQMDINCLVELRKRVGFGVTYRHQESVAGLLSFRVTDQFVISYGYDYGTSGLAQYNAGSHELMLRYNFGYTVNADSPR